MPIKQKFSNTPKTKKAILYYKKKPSNQEAQTDTGSISNKPWHISGKKIKDSISTVRRILSN
nr:hypothetical protein [Peribacillus butanolivorans]